MFIPSKFELPANAAADRSTVALEELTNALNSKRSRDIPFTDKGINNAIRALRNVLSTTGRGNDRHVQGWKLGLTGRQRWLITTQIGLHNLQGCSAIITTTVRMHNLQGCITIRHGI